MTRPSASGRIEVVCGCMFSGKTEELIRRVRHVRIARQAYRIFTPRRDTRYGSGVVASHSGEKLEAQIITSITQVLGHCDDVQVAAVDELHFLDDDAATVRDVCQTLADRGLRVIVAGLDQSYRAEPFPQMAELMAVADQVDKLYAICVRCGAYATRSQRLIDGRPAPYNAPTLVVGGLDLYEARCRACFVRPGAEA
jgi:thymidine kinase